MNWYKIANPSRANDLTEISEYIKYISEIVFQTSRGAGHLVGSGGSGGGGLTGGLQPRCGAAVGSASRGHTQGILGEGSRG